MAQELLEWLAGSARFRAFAEAHRDKIRKKVRGATDADGNMQPVDQQWNFGGYGNNGVQRVNVVVR